MFLRLRGRLVGRVTFTEIEYTKINDKYMDEASRYYDGTVYTGPEQELNDCPAPSEPYEEAVGPIGPLPRMVFREASSGRVVEVRDYRRLEQRGGGERWEFQVVGATARRVTVLAYQEREPIMAIYYDRLSQRIRLKSNFSGQRGCERPLQLTGWGSEWAAASSWEACR
jgi:hypothetical protein